MQQRINEHSLHITNKLIQQSTRKQTITIIEKRQTPKTRATTNTTTTATTQQTHTNTYKRKTST